MDRSRLAELFEQALDLAPEQRARFVDESCADDAELRAHLERLLRADASAGDFLEASPGFVAAAESDAAKALAPPETFGSWRVVRSLGSGGMGEVWLAERDDGEFEQRVAVKRLAWPTPGLLQRFRQERQILARLEHPGIARLIDGGVDAFGIPYFAMEYVEGTPILEHAREQALDLRARLRLFVRVCDAVQFAHRNLVVHRDLKPSNILVGADGAPKLLDFGIAKLLATTGDDGAKTATRLLTPAYAAPEQFDGRPVTTATDVYALGVVLHELLCDAKPRWTPTNRDGDARTGQAMPPSATLAATDPRRRALRGDLDRIVQTALAADPQQRYVSVEGLASDIERHLDGRPISVRRASRRYRMTRFVARHRFGVAATTVILAIGIVTAALYLRQVQRALAEAARADAVRQFLVGVFEQANPDENRGQPFTAPQLLEKSERALAGAGKPDVVADLTALIAGLYWDIGDTERAEKLKPRLQAAADDASLPAVVRARSLNQLARFEVDQRMLDAAVVHARTALALLEADDASAEASTARHLLANALAGQGDDQAEPFLRELLARDRGKFGERSEQVGDDLLLLGIALDMRSRPGEAAAAMQEQLAIARALHGPVHSTVSNGLNMLALALQHQGDFDGAEAAFREAIEAETQRLGPDQPQVLVIRSNLLDVLDLRGAFDRALPQRLELCAIEHKVLAGTLDAQIALDVQSLGNEYFEHGDFDGAEASAREALDIWARVQGSNDKINSARPLEQLGLVQMWQGRFAEGETSLRRALAILKAANSPAQARVHGELGELLLRAHRGADARREFSAASALPAASAHSPQGDAAAAIFGAQLAEVQLEAGDVAAGAGTAAGALELARAALPKGNWKLGKPLYALARARLAEGRFDEAETLLREARSVRSPPHPAGDPRVLEIDVMLVEALVAQRKHDEARTLAQSVSSSLAASTLPYCVELRERLARLHAS